MNDTFSQIKTGKEDTVTIIQDDVINSLAPMKIFDDERDDRLDELHKELLVRARKNNNNEVCILWDYIKGTIVVTRGTINRVKLDSNEEAIKLLESSKSLLAMHNHPRNGLFSRKDLMTFGLREGIRIMTVVCNDGTIYAMKKEPGFDFGAMISLYNKNISEVPYSGTKAIAKHAKKLGLYYKCCMKRRLSLYVND